MTLATARWPELDGTEMSGVLVPVGSLEQHGPHLPLDTDTRIACAVAERLDGGGWFSAPPVAFGASGEHETFPGTVSIGSQVLHDVLVELGRSACRWAGKIMFVNGHGGNHGALCSAVALLRREGRDTAWAHCAVPGGDAHAGRTETSLLLALAPDTVRMDLAVPGNVEPLQELMPVMRSGSVRAVSESGVLGDPTGANAAEGARLLAGVVRDVGELIARWTPDETGRLR